MAPNKKGTGSKDDRKGEEMKQSGEGEKTRKRSLSQRSRHSDTVTITVASSDSESSVEVNAAPSVPVAAAPKAKLGGFDVFRMDEMNKMAGDRLKYGQKLDRVKKAWKGLDGNQRQPFRDRANAINLAENRVNKPKKSQSTDDKDASGTAPSKKKPKKSQSTDDKDASGTAPSKKKKDASGTAPSKKKPKK